MIAALLLKLPPQPPPPPHLAASVRDFKHARECEVHGKLKDLK